MRYKCNICDQWIKDKFIFGLVHFCLTEEEYQQKINNKILLRNQQERANQTLGTGLNDDFIKKIFGG